VQGQEKGDSEGTKFRTWIQTYAGLSETGFGYNIGVNAGYKYVMLGARSITHKEFCLSCYGDGPNIMHQNNFLVGPRLEYPIWSASILTGMSFVSGRYWEYGNEPGIYHTIRFEGKGTPIEVNFILREKFAGVGFSVAGNLNEFNPSSGVYFGMVFGLI
jgi:hypothetical protein